jgi:hypothetical protein
MRRLFQVHPASLAREVNADAQIDQGRRVQRLSRSAVGRARVSLDLADA